MIQPTPSGETIHASCVAIDGKGVLLYGRSGFGKSDLALRLIDRGAVLVSDDYTILRPSGGRLIASAPPSIAGKLEVRGLGIIDIETAADVAVALCVILDEPVDRMPGEEQAARSFAGVSIPAVTLQGLEPSTPIKVEIALDMIGKSH